MALESRISSAMANTSLPDEIISEILSPALTVDDDVFTESLGSAWPPRCFTMSSLSAPKAQAKALAGVLSQNAELGRFIRKLRVEGGYGAPMQTILKCSPNVTDLFLSLNMFALDSTDGLCKGFAHISPTKLILDDDSYKNNKAISKLAEGLVKVIPKWDRLTAIDFSNMSIGSARTTMISKPIIDSLRLTTIVVKYVHHARAAFKMFAACPLEVIQIKIMSRFRSDDALLESELKTANLKIVIKYNSTRRNPTKLAGERQILSSVDIAPSLNPDFVPLRSDPPELQDLVWSHILRFVFLPPKAHHDQSHNVLLVSQQFLRAGRPHFYEEVAIKSRLCASRLARTLVAKPAYGDHIQVLNLHHFYVPSYAGSFSFLRQPSVSEYDSDIRGILRNAPNLTSLVSLACRKPTDSNIIFYMSQTLSDLAITWQHLTLLGQTAGATLRDLSIEVARRSARDVNGDTARVFGTFVELRTLIWRSHAEAGVFTFFEVLSKMALPSLRHLTIISKVFCDSLLASHGDRLTTLCICIAALSEPSSSSAGSHASTLTTHNACVLDLCPNLSELTLLYEDHMHLLCDPSFVSSFFDSQNPAQLLTIIKFILPVAAGHKDYMRLWEDLFATFAKQIGRCTPALQDIVLSSRAVSWPTNEREIAKSAWVRIAESVLAVGVQVADSSGKKWRPRLSATRAVVPGTARVRRSRKDD
ncbi:hypothetical protein C8F01DRAFT_1339347 [Mycena amicta]|nr:hypothetical protein C8F01DRAFT_1339347 [Mycena amicta]